MPPQDCASELTAAHSACSPTLVRHFTSLALRVEAFWGLQASMLALALLKVARWRCSGLDMCLFTIGVVCCRQGRGLSGLKIIREYPSMFGVCGLSVWKLFAMLVARLKGVRRPWIMLPLVEIRSVVQTTHSKRLRA